VCPLHPQLPSLLSFPGPPRSSLPGPGSKRTASRRGPSPAPAPEAPRGAPTAYQALGKSAPSLREGPAGQAGGLPRGTPGSVRGRPRTRGWQSQPHPGRCRLQTQWTRGRGSSTQCRRLRCRWRPFRGRAGGSRWWGGPKGALCSLTTMLTILPRYCRVQYSAAQYNTVQHSAIPYSSVVLESRSWLIYHEKAFPFAYSANMDTVVYHGVPLTHCLRPSVNGAQIRATLQAARQRFDSVPVWVVFQPHTYSRTARLMDDLAEAFSAANRVIVTEVSGGRQGYSDRGQWRPTRLL